MFKTLYPNTTDFEIDIAERCRCPEGGKRFTAFISQIREQEKLRWQLIVKSGFASMDAAERFIQSVIPELKGRLDSINEPTKIYLYEDWCW